MFYQMAADETGPAGYQDHDSGALRKATSEKQLSAELPVCWVLICSRMPFTRGAGRP